MSMYPLIQSKRFAQHRLLIFLCEFRWECLLCTGLRKPYRQGLHRFQWFYSLQFKMQIEIKDVSMWTFCTIFCVIFVNVTSLPVVSNFPLMKGPM